MKESDKDTKYEWAIPHPFLLLGNMPLDTMCDDTRDVRLNCALTGPAMTRSSTARIRGEDAILNLLAEHVALDLHNQAGYVTDSGLHDGHTPRFRPNGTAGSERHEQSSSKEPARSTRVRGQQQSTHTHSNEQ